MSMPRKSKYNDAIGEAFNNGLIEGQEAERLRTKEIIAEGLKDENKFISLRKILERNGFEVVIE